MANRVSRSSDFRLLKVKMRSQFNGEGGLWNAIRALPKHAPKKKEKAMDKYGVVIDDEKTKTASTEKSCPECGADLSKEETPNYCPNCGTRPFEKRPTKEK